MDKSEVKVVLDRAVADGTLPHDPCKPSNPKHVSTDLAYAAGIIDGEGCIGMYHNSHNGNYQLRITVEMVETSAIDLLKALFGGRLYFKKAKAPRRARTMWMVFNREAAATLEKLLPYMRVKRQHAEIALRGTWSGWNSFRQLPDSEKVLREQMNKEIKALNVRGYSEERI